MNTYCKICVALVLMMFVPRAYSQSEAVAGAEKGFKKADTELNRMYKTVINKMADERQKADFVKAQEAWLKFRDADAESRAGYTGGGSAYTVDYLADLADLTEARTKELKEFLKRMAR